MSLLQSFLTASRDPFFWALLLAYFCAISYGIFTLTRMFEPHVAWRCKD